MKIGPVVDFCGTRILANDCGVVQQTEQCFAQAYAVALI